MKTTLPHSQRRNSIEVIINAWPSADLPTSQPGKFVPHRFGRCNFTLY
jgi:hypothetical protein